MNKFSLQFILHYSVNIVYSIKFYNEQICFILTENITHERFTIIVAGLTNPKSGGKKKLCSLLCLRKFCKTSWFESYSQVDFELIFFPFLVFADRGYSENG